MRTLTDEQLIRESANGNSRAMDMLVHRYHAKVLDFAFRHLNDREAAADVAQAAFVQAFQASSRFANRSTFKTWLYSIALNLIRDDARRKGRQRESLQSQMQDAMDWEQAELDPGIELVSFSDLWPAVAKLPEDQRTSIILRFQQGLTYNEIGEIMKAPEGTVKSWVHFALKALKRVLDPELCGLFLL
ncbi:MAG: sigma-70 family RNA polymerase sigma factor [Armatimonadota bacterium]